LASASSQTRSPTLTSSVLFGRRKRSRRAEVLWARAQKSQVVVEKKNKGKEKPTFVLADQDLSINDSIVTIALPAFFALAADPIASLVDSAWIGRIGAVSLTASGLAIAVLNIVVKLFNSPLLSVTTSVIAKAYVSPKRDLSKAASTAIELGLLAGAAQTILIFVGAPLLIHLMGVDSNVDSELYHTAVSFLRIKALGAPANVLLLTTQGIFRGLGDTKRPLFATVVGNVLNVGLAPLLIFGLDMGADGAAWATVVCEYISALYLIFIVYEKIPGFEIGKSLTQNKNTFSGAAKQLLGTSGILAFRSLCIVGTYAIASSLSLEAGDEFSAAHQVCQQLWLGSTLLADALAVAAQTLLAQALTKEDKQAVKEIVAKTVGVGLTLGTVTALLIQLSNGFLPSLFTDDKSVLEGIEYLLPFVIWTQPITAVAFVFDGVLYGGSDFNFAAKVMFVGASVACTSMYAGVNFFADSDFEVLSSIWIGYTILMTLRLLVILYRMQDPNAPYRKYLLSDDKEPTTS
jgi:putative MATE family efflux protein